MLVESCVSTCYQGGLRISAAVWDGTVMPVAFLTLSAIPNSLVALGGILRVTQRRNATLEAAFTGPTIEQLLCSSRRCQLGWQNVGE